MDIVVHESSDELAAWVADLQAALPQARVRAWAPGAAAADYAVVWAPPQQLLDEQTRLRAIFNTGAGVDRLLQRRLPPGVPVLRLRDAGMAVQMAEYVLQAVIRHHRGLDALTAQQAQGQWVQPPVRERADCVVGILGHGVLGQRVAQALQALDYPVRAWTRSPHPQAAVPLMVGREALGDFVSGCAVLVNLLPLTPDTEGLLDHALLSRLPRGAMLVNVARGAHLVDEDLLALLDSGHIARAWLDVFRQEPLPAAHRFWRHPSVHLTPHTSARTLRGPSVAQIAQAIAAIERGEPVSTVDPTRGY